MADKIWYVIEAIIEITNIILCYSLFFQAKINKKNHRIIIAYVGIILCSVLNMVLKLGIDQMLLGVLYCCVMPLYLMEKTKVKWMLLYPCALTISSIINIIPSYVIAIVLDKPQGELIETIWIRAIGNLFFTLIFGVIYLYKKKKNKSKWKLYWNNTIYASVAIGTITFYLLLSLIQFIGKEYEVPTVFINLLGLFISIVCVVFFAFFLWLSSSIHSNELYQREKDMMNIYLIEQEKHIKNIIQKDIDMRRFRHDIKEHMWIISEHISKSNYTKAEEYIKKMYGELESADISSYTGIVALDAVIHDKKRIMEEKGISLNWSGEKNQISPKFELYDLCTLFTNILNNAIEACQVLNKADRNIDVAVDVDNNRLYIRAKNKTSNIVVMDDDGNPVSSKDDKINHGYGSKNIRNVVDKYNGEINYSVDNQVFCVEIFI